MSKREGQKVVIKFTDDLVGAISNNELAFSVEGQEYKYVKGPLLYKEYAIDSVIRYPIQPLWSVNFTTGTLINTELTDYVLTLGVMVE